MWGIYKVVIITEGKSGSGGGGVQQILFRGPLDQALAHVEGRRGGEEGGRQGESE